MVDTLEIGHYYKLLDSVWLRANPADAGMLCLGCVERRLGRSLTLSDFPPAPCNAWPLTARVLAELLGMLPATVLDWFRATIESGREEEARS